MKMTVSSRKNIKTKRGWLDWNKAGPRAILDLWKKNSKTHIEIPFASVLWQICRGDHSEINDISSLPYGRTADKGLEVMRFAGFIPTVQIYSLHRLTLNNSIMMAQIIRWAWVGLVWKETERHAAGGKEKVTRKILDMKELLTIATSDTDPLNAWESPSLKTRSTCSADGQ